jgi:hypothetical protein
MTVALNDFVRRQTPESPYSHFVGSENYLVALVTAYLNKGWQGYKPGVLLVPVPPEKFRANVVSVTSQTELRATFEARREPEARFLSVRAKGEKVQAKHVFVVLYSKEVLGDEATSDADWEIVSINARESEIEEPMDPMTMARNFLVLEGGTKGDFTAQQFAESIVFWSTHALVDQEKP